MDRKMILLLLLTCGSPYEGNSEHYRALPGVNSRKGSTREAKPFHCTKHFKVTTKPSRRSLLLTSTSTAAKPESSETLESTIDPDSGPRNHWQSTLETPTPTQPFETTNKQLTSEVQKLTSLTSSNKKTYLQSTTEAKDLWQSTTDMDGETAAPDDCSEICTCNNNQLSCNDSANMFRPLEPCTVKEDGVLRCNSYDDYLGDGEICRKPYTDCYDARQAGYQQDALYIIRPRGWQGIAFDVWCDMTTSGSGWTLLQRRVHTGDSVAPFDLTWEKYKHGFSYTEGNCSVWLGNEKIFYLTNQRNYKLRVDLVFSDSSTKYQEYSLFKIADEVDNYQLIELGNNSGTAGDGMDGAKGKQFSTYVKDYDECPNINCSDTHGRGGWWYSNKWCNSSGSSCPSSNYCIKRCTKGNLNGMFGSQHLYKGVFWTDNYNISSTEMKIRPVDCNRTFAT